MSLLGVLKDRLTIPVIGSPMFIASGPELVIAQCTAGIVGTMPSRSVRDPAELGQELDRIADRCQAYQLAHPESKVAPFGVNLVVHKSNDRFDHDFGVCVERKVPLIITSLGPSRAVVDKVHAYGGHVLHDVVNMRHARKAIAEGVDGVILVCNGAGGHAGSLSAFALLRELRQEYDGLIVLAGAISDGWGVFGAIAMGADLAYVGTRFIATREGGASDENKQMLLEATADDILYTPWTTGVPGNYLKPSMVRAGLDPANLPPKDGSINVTSDRKPKAWKDIWSAGQGVGSIKDIPSTAQLVQRMTQEYGLAAERAAGLSRFYQ